jgi:secreted trypsin-like serine protease
MKLNNLLIILFMLKSSACLFIFQNREISVKKPRLPTAQNAELLLKRGRVSNSYIAEKGSEFLPFFTLIYVRKINTKFAMCAGSIISENYVITAGHCFEIAAEVYILAGFQNSQIESFTFYDQVLAENVKIHPDYNSTTISNDIAIIQLSKQLTFNMLIQNIHLPSVNSNFISKNGIVSGFGVYSDQNPVVSNVLRYTFVSVTDSFVCEKSYLSYFSSKEQLCIDTKSGSSCSGDSGEKT